MIEITKVEYKQIFSKVTKDPVTKCWIWTGAKNRGYGAINFRGKTAKVHRLVYEIFIGDLPKYNGINVLDHVVCDTPACCNPKHVKLVKQSYNILRANSISGRNKRKTHCIRGHLFSKIKEPYGKGKFARRCVTCRNVSRMRRYYSNKSK